MTANDSNVYRTNKAQRALTVTLKNNKKQGVFRHTQSADMQ